jgi:hypothetical protein
MNVTAFTFILAPLCLLWFSSPTKLLQLLLIAGVFEAAAALTLGGVGLQPGMAPGLTFLAYMAIQGLLGARFAGTAEALHDTRPFVALTVYAVLSSVIMPRLFEGIVFVWPQKATPPFVLTALEPNASNLNQDFYLLINCAFLVAATIFMTKSRVSLMSLFRTYLYSGVVVAGVSVWEFANRLAGVPYPESLFYSNPGWAVLTEQSIGSTPRINGPFSEPSALGGYMVAIVCATSWLLLQGHRDRILPRMLIVGLFTTMISTSSTGFGVLALLGAGVPAYGLVTGSRRLLAGVAKIGIPLLLLVAIIYGGASIFSPQFNKNVEQIIDGTLNKRGSDSYESRTSTDIDSLAVAIDTYGLGAGWGSNRSSSLLPGLLSTVGVPGLLCLLWFAFGIARRVRAAKRAGCSKEYLFVIDGCCGALAGYLLAALLSGPTINALGFYFLLALLIACTIRVELQIRAGRSVQRKLVARAAFP